MTHILSENTGPQLVDDGLFPGGVHVFDTIGSTNDWSLQQLRRGVELPFVCIADHQSSGRGRRGRHWLSPAGANIYLSLAWQFDLAPERLGLLALAQGVAVTKALKRIGIDDAWLKWPNDVMIDEDKIAGILVETAGVRTNGCKVVIGIGLNYRMPEHVTIDPAIRWTDVAHVLDDEVPPRHDLVSIVLEEAVETCRRYQLEAEAIISDIRHEMEGLNGRDVCVHLENGSRFSGAVLGIDATGQLRVRVDGRERVFSSADVSLRKPRGQHRSGGAC